MTTLTLPPAWLSFTLGFCVLALCLFTAVQAWKTVAQGPLVQGKILRIEDKHYIVQALVEGQSQEIKIDITTYAGKKPIHAVNETVDVRLSSKDVSRSKLAGFTELWIVPLVTLLIATFFFAIGTEFVQRPLLELAASGGLQNIMMGGAFFLALLFVGGAIWLRQGGLLAGGIFMLFCTGLLYYLTGKNADSLFELQKSIRSRYEAQTENKAVPASELLNDYITFAGEKIKAYRKPAQPGQELFVLGIHTMVGSPSEYNHAIPFEVGGLQKVGQQGVMTADNARLVAIYPLPKNESPFSFYALSTEHEALLSSTVEKMRSRWGYSVHLKPSPGTSIYAKDPHLMPDRWRQITQILLRPNADGKVSVQVIQFIPGFVILFGAPATASLVEEWKRLETEFQPFLNQAF